MTSKLVVNTIEADTGISSVSFASSISMSSTSKFHFSDAGIDIGADTNINRPATGVIGFNINSGEKVRITSNGQLVIGHTASHAIDTGHEFRVQVSGTDYATSGITQQRFQNAVSGASLALAHSRNGTQGSHTALQSNDEYGKIRFYGSDGTDFDGYGAAIVAKVDGAVGVNSTPGRLEFYTTASGSNDATERLRIHSNGDISCGGAADNNIYNDTSGGGINFKNGGQLVIAKQATSGADPLVWLNDTGQTTNKFLLFAQDGTEKASIGLAGDALRFARDGYNETLRISSNGDVRVGSGAPTTFGSGTTVFETYNTNTYVANLVTSGSTVLQMIASQTHGASSIGTRSNHNLYLTTNDQTRVMINTDGDLKVGTTGNSGAKIQIGNHTFAGTNFVYNNDRVGLQNNGSLTCISNCSTYDNGTYPGYGFVLVQGASTSSYNVWGICPDGPAKGNSLNLHYGAQATNIHEPNKSQFEFTGNGYFLKPNMPAFHARPPGNYTLSGDQIIGGTWSTGDSESFVRGTLTNGTSIWSNSTGIFTVPVTGIYYFHWNVFLKNNTTRRDAMIYRNGTGSGNIIARTEIGEPNGTTANNKNVAVSAVVSLSVNDTIRFGCLTTGGTNIYQTVRPWSYACGYLIG